MADLQIIVGICHSEDAGPHWNHRPDQAIRISEPIVPLVVAADDVGHRLHVIQRHQCLPSQNGMPSVLRSFFIGSLGTGLASKVSGKAICPMSCMSPAMNASVDPLPPCSWPLRCDGSDSPHG